MLGDFLCSAIRQSGIGQGYLVKMVVSLRKSEEKVLHRI